MDVRTPLVTHPQPAELVQPTTPASAPPPTCTPPGHCREPPYAGPRPAQCPAAARLADAPGQHKPEPRKDAPADAAAVPAEPRTGGTASTKGSSCVTSWQLARSRLPPGAASSGRGVGKHMMLAAKLAPVRP